MSVTKIYYILFFVILEAHLSTGLEISDTLLSEIVEKFITLENDRLSFDHARLSFDHARLSMEGRQAVMYSSVGVLLSAAIAFGLSNLHAGTVNLREITSVFFDRASTLWGTKIKGDLKRLTISLLGVTLALAPKIQNSVSFIFCKIIILGHRLLRIKKLET